MALEVISDPVSEGHRNWVSSTVVGALGMELDQGVWILRLYALEPGGIRITLGRSGGAVFEMRVARPGKDRQRDLARALEGVIRTL